MTQTAINYAQVLYELHISPEDIMEADRILQENKEVLTALTSPVLVKDKKYRLIEQIFPKSLHNFLKTASGYGSLSLLPEIFREYHFYYNKQQNILSASLSYVSAPTQAQLTQIKDFLMKKYDKSDIELTMIYAPWLLGGFVIDVDCYEYDWSLKGRLNSLKQKLIWR